MAPPITPSDSAKPDKGDASKHDEHRTNFLDIMSEVKQNALAPAFNNFAVVPINVLGNVVNFASDAGTWATNKVTGGDHKAFQVGKVSEMEVAKVQQNSVAGWSQQIFGTAGSFLAYATAGKIAGKVLRTGGELLPAELEFQNLKVGVAARAFAQDARIANVVGATTYAGLKDPVEGESRLSNAASTLVGFSLFEAGNAHFVNPANSALFRLGQRYTVGSIGGIAQVNVASVIQHGHLADANTIAASGLSGGVLNALMPAGRHIADASVENRVFKSIPHVTDATAKLYSDAVKALPKGKAPEPGSWADPNAVRVVNELALHDLDTRLTFDHSAEESESPGAKAPKEAPSLEAGKPAHTAKLDADLDPAPDSGRQTDDANPARRKRGKKSKVQNTAIASKPAQTTKGRSGSRSSSDQEPVHSTVVSRDAEQGAWIDHRANVIHHTSSDQPLDVVEELAHRKIFKDPSYEQHFYSYAQELVSRNPSDPRNQMVKEKYINTRLDQEIAARTTENEEAVKLGLPIRVAVNRDVIRFKEGYGSRFAQEADVFISSGGKARPEIDFSGGAAARIPYAYIEQAPPVAPVADRVVLKPDDIKIVATGKNALDRGATVSTTDGAAKPPELVIVGGTDSPAARETARVERTELISNWERISNQIIRSSTDPKDRPQNSLFSVIKDKVISSGLARDGWVVLPTETGSPLDQVGCDYALVSLRKNQVIFLDATQNQAKIQNPHAHNVSDIRAGGIIGFESKWLDMMDKLKIDDEGSVGRDARDFNSHLDSQLKGLAQEGSPITIDMLPSAMRQSTALATQEQVDQFRIALTKRSAEYSAGSLDRQQLEDYSRDLQRGAAKYNEFKVATKASPLLADAMQRQSDRVVLDYVLGKLRIKAASEAPPVENRNVRVNKEGHLVLTVDNMIYDGGDVKESLTESRRALRAEPQRLEALLQREKSVLNKMKAHDMTLPQILKLVQEELVSAREVDNGMLGTTNIGLDEALRGRIVQQNLDDAVAGRAPKVVEKPREIAPKSVAIRAGGFTPEQQVEIPKMATIMSDFGLNIRDGVDPNDLKAFVEMYAENANSPAAREMSAQYTAEVDKPMSEQRLIPRLHGALVAAQMRFEYQLGVNGDLAASGSDNAAAPSGSNRIKATADLIADTSKLPFEQVKIAMDRLKVLQTSNELSPEQTFERDALQAFKSHMLDPNVRAAVAKNYWATTTNSSGMAMLALSYLAIKAWYTQHQTMLETEKRTNSATQF